MSAATADGTLGWRQLRELVQVMNEHRTEQQSDPDRWDDTADQAFADLRAKRDRARGR